MIRCRKGADQQVCSTEAEMNSEALPHHTDSASNARYFSRSVACSEVAHLFRDGGLGIDLLSLHLNLILNADGVLGLQL